MVYTLLILKVPINRTDAGLGKDCLLQENTRFSGEAGFNHTILHSYRSRFVTRAMGIRAAGKCDTGIDQENRPCMTSEYLHGEMKTD